MPQWIKCHDDSNMDEPWSPLFLLSEQFDLPADALRFEDVFEILGLNVSINAAIVDSLKEIEHQGCMGYVEGESSLIISWITSLGVDSSCDRVCIWFR